MTTRPADSPTAQYTASEALAALSQHPPNKNKSLMAVEPAAVEPAAVEPASATSAPLLDRMKAKGKIAWTEQCIMVILKAMLNHDQCLEARSSWRHYPLEAYGTTEISAIVQVITERATPHACIREAELGSQLLPMHAYNAAPLQIATDVRT